MKHTLKSLSTLVAAALAMVLCASTFATDPSVVASNITVTAGKTTASFVGSCISTQNLGMAITLYYGLSDVGSTSTSWTHTNRVGTVTSGEQWVASVGVLASDARYYYNVFATDTYTNTAHLATTGSFTTGGKSGSAASALLTNAVMPSVVNVGGTPYGVSCASTIPALNAVRTWTPSYHTVTLLDSTTNPVSLVICTNMPIVTAVTNAQGSAVILFELTP